MHLLGKIAAFRDISQPQSQYFWVAQLKQQISNSELNLPDPGLPFNPVYVRKDVSLEIAHENMFQYAKQTGVTIASVDIFRRLAR